MQLRVAGHWEDTGQNHDRAPQEANQPEIYNRLQSVLDSAFGSGRRTTSIHRKVILIVAIIVEKAKITTLKATVLHTKTRIKSIPGEVITPSRAFSGHRNCRTICKEATFYGMFDEYIISGSDDGRIFGKRVQAIYWVLLLEIREWSTVYRGGRRIFYSNCRY